MERHGHQAFPRRLDGRVLDPATTALIVVDLQYGSASRHHGIGLRMQREGRAQDGQERFDRIESLVVPNTVRLLEHCRRADAFIVFLTVNVLRSDLRDAPKFRRALAEWKRVGAPQVALSNGRTAHPREHEILDEVAPVGDELVFNKVTIGGFNSTSLSNVLRTAGIRTVVVCGVSTNSCVESTVRGAADRLFDVVLVEDACGAALNELHDESVSLLAGQFCSLATTDELTESLRRVEIPAGNLDPAGER